MDSMRSLNTSLPGASPPKQYPNEPPEQLLQSFKAAALSVTKLYKTAAADLGRARAEGYQDALDELLAYLDKEDIGLSDGEGWRIRRWATERLDGRDSQNMESDDESGEKLDRASSPEVQRSQSTTRLSPTVAAARTSSPARASSPARSETQASPPIITPNEATTLAPPQGMFTFRSSHPYPQDADMTLPDLELSDNARTQSHDGAIPSHTSGPPITITRPPRTNARHANLSSRLNTRSSGSLSRQTGQKRKINFAELFDISTSHCKDGSGGGGKRGRFI